MHLHYKDVEEFDNYNGDEFFAMLIDASSVMICILDQSGQILHENTVSSRTAPVTADDRLWESRWPEASRHHARRAIMGALEGRPAALRLRTPLPDGGSAYFDVQASPIRTGDGRTVRVLVRYEDVTEKVEGEAFLRTILDTLPSALTVQDARTGRYILSNRAADALFARPDGLKGLTSHDVLPPELATWESDQPPSPMRTRRTFHAPAADRPDRRLCTVRAATYDDDGPRHVINLTEDVTLEHRNEAALREAAERARQAELTRHEFLSNISHELRTPLNGVIAGLDLLERAPETGAEVFAMIRASATTLHALIEDLIETVDQTPADEGEHDEILDCVRLLETVAAAHRESAVAKGLALAVEVSTFPAVSGNARRLQGILNRLVENAVKFSNRGHVVLRAEALPDGMTRFSVTDDGPGFDPGQKAQLFEGFRRHDQSLTRDQGGLGLGLTLAQRAARSLGGRIDAQQRPAGGSVFWLDAPLRPSPLPEQSKRAVSAPLKILIADDHAANRRVVQLLMNDLAEIVPAEDGQEAVDIAGETGFDLILMDIQMPRLDGISAVARIRADEVSTGRRRTPIIMLTANTQAEYMTASRAAGADGLVGKPFTATSLLEGIQAVVALPAT